MFAGRPRARSAHAVYERWRAWWRTAGGKAEEAQARERAGQRHRHLALAEVAEQEPVGTGGVGRSENSLVSYRMRGVATI